MKTDLILIGGGGHCKACIDVIETSNTFNILGIFDKNAKIGSKLLGYEYIGTDDDIASCKNKNVKFLITLGQIESPALRKELYEKLIKTNNQLATVISSRAYVSKWAKVGKGTIVMHDALVNAGAIIGNNCIINSKALIEHDCIIGSNCHISTAAVINGNTHITEGTFFGSNAVSKHSVTVKQNSFIKAGSCFKEHS